MLLELEGRTWPDLVPRFVEAFPDGLICAGDVAFGSLLPAYLDYLLALEGYGEALYAVANQLTRKPDDLVDQRIFDARVAVLDDHQRAVVSRIVEHLAARQEMAPAMGAALASWQAEKGMACLSAVPSDRHA
jgi:hypothetical protein